MSENDWITYGPDENCTLALCPAEWSLYGYRPSLAANVVLLILFAISMAISVYQGIKWRTWGFLGPMVWGYICELLGYGGRLILYQNPFSFPGFLLQIICLTVGPAFYSAAIYLVLSKVVVYCDPKLSRIAPKYYLWIFIPCDIVSLTLQAAGGGTSSSTSGASKMGVDLALAGLSTQVFTLTVFSLLAIDFGIRYRRSPNKAVHDKKTDTRFRIFIFFTSLATILILIRCIYRIDELSDGYNGPLIHNQGLFIALEGVMIIISAFCLNVAHPGPVFGRTASIDSAKVEEEAKVREDSGSSGNQETQPL